MDNNQIFRNCFVIIYCYLTKVSSQINKCISFAPLEFFFQEQSYSSLHSVQSLAWHHVRGDIDDPYGAIANFCGVIANFCGVTAIPEAIGGRAGADAVTPIVAQLAKHHKTLLNIVKHHETHVKHYET